MNSSKGYLDTPWGILVEYEVCENPLQGKTVYHVYLLEII